jgi:hypothetical protein
VTRNIAVPLVTAVLLSACSQSTIDYLPRARPPTLKSDAVPHAKSDVTVLNVERVTTGALEAARLTALLGSAGFVGGTERSFVSDASPLDRASTRVLRFAHDQGAAEYLRWVEAHPGDLIGDAKPSDPLEVAGDPNVYVHQPNGCCAKDIPKALAVWQRDRYVMEVIASGAYAKDQMLSELASEMDRLV